MANQRTTQLFRIFYTLEGGTETTDPTTATPGTATESFLAEDIQLSGITLAHLPRRFRGNMGYFLGRIGEQGDPGLSFTCELRNRGVTNSVVDLDELLKTCWGARIPAGVAAAEGAATTIASSTDGANFVLTSGAAFSNGQGIMVEGPVAGVYESGIIDTIAGATVVLKRGLSFTPTGGGTKAAKPMVTYATADSGHQSLSFQVWLDASEYISFVGCKGNVAISVDSTGAIPKLKFDFKAIAWAHRTGGARPLLTPGDSNVAPPAALGSTFKRDTNAIGVGAGVKTDIRSFMLDLGNKVARKKSHNSVYGTYSQVIADRTPSGKLSIYDIGQTHFTDWLAGTERGFSHQMQGPLSPTANLFNTVLVCVPNAQITKVAYGDDGGLTVHEIDFNADITKGADDAYLALG